MIKSRFDIPPLLSGIGAELGVYRGVFSEKLLAGSQLRKLYSIDPWAPCYCFPTDEEAEQTYKEVKERLAPFGERSAIFRATSQRAAQFFPVRYFDFLYIDSSHIYEETREELALYYPKMKPGSWFCGHDYANGEGVKKAVDEFALKHGLSIETTVRDEDTDWTGYTVNSWLIRVPY